MKKYRSLGYMSTTNHNILYFVDVPRTILLNMGIRLWKARKTLIWRRFLAQFLPQILCNRLPASRLQPYPEA
jgi:hypothetical protein